MKGSSLLLTLDDEISKEMGDGHKYITKSTRCTNKKNNKWGMLVQKVRSGQLRAFWPIRKKRSAKQRGQVFILDRAMS